MTKNWKILQQTQQQVAQKLLDFVSKTLDPEILEEAWTEFFAGETEDDFDAHHPLNPVFFPWFFFNWQDELNENTTIAELFISANEGLTKVELDLLKSGINSRFTFWEVLEVRPKEQVKIKDLLTKLELTVYETSGTKYMKPGDIIFAKTVCTQKIHLFEATAPVIIPSKYKLNILRLKHYLAEELDPDFTNHDIPLILQFQMLDFFHEVYDEIMNPAAPVFTNTEKHLLIPHKMIFEISSAKEAFEAFHPLCNLASREDMLKMAKYSLAQDLVEIDFPWLSKKKKNEKPIVWGHIQISGKKMTVEVNSKERMERFLELLKKIGFAGIKLKSTLIESIESQTQLPKSTPPLAFTPEELRIMQLHFEDHWNKWPMTKIPALDNKKPQDVVKTKKGRELVEAMIADFEATYKTKPLPGMSFEIFKKLRNKLGLSNDE